MLCTVSVVIVIIVRAFSRRPVTTMSVLPAKLISCFLILIPLRASWIVSACREDCTTTQKSPELGKLNSIKIKRLEYLLLKDVLVPQRPSEYSKDHRKFVVIPIRIPPRIFHDNSVIEMENLSLLRTGFCNSMEMVQMSRSPLKTSLLSYELR